MDELRAESKRLLGDKIHPDAPAFVIIEEDNCKIYVLKNKDLYQGDQMWNWGHELSHCLYGLWHPPHTK